MPLDLSPLEKSLSRLKTSVSYLRSAAAGADAEFLLERLRRRAG